VAYDPIARWENEGGALLSMGDGTRDRPRAEIARVHPNREHERTASDKAAAVRDAREDGAWAQRVELPLDR
jgi:hypothetical protein